MNQLKVKTESLATRCDICHQADCYDAVRNFCTRCNGVSDILALQARALELRDRLTRMRSMYNADGLTTLNNNRGAHLPIWVTVPAQIFLWISLGFAALGLLMGIFSLRILNGLLLGAVAGIVLGAICAIITATIIISALTIRWAAEWIIKLINQVRRP